MTLPTWAAFATPLPPSPPQTPAASVSVAAVGASAKRSAFVSGRSKGRARSALCAGDIGVSPVALRRGRRRSATGRPRMSVADAPEKLPPARSPFYVESDGDEITPPAGFVASTPRLFSPRGDRVADFVSGALGALARGGSGAFVSGYRFRLRDSRSSSTSSTTATATTDAGARESRPAGYGERFQRNVLDRLEEESASLPSARPAPGSLKLYDMEACPFCRKVREALCYLDLDVLMFPCPKGGERYRAYVERRGGKQRFPYLVDDNSGFAGYESDDIVKYLFQTYGDGRVPAALALGPLTTFSAGLASLARAGRGSKKAGDTAVPRAPLELFAYEASPFSKMVRERLTELELPYLLHNCSRGSVNRGVLRRLTGREQMPYLVDPNTTMAMFESADICDYLDATYGPESDNARRRRERKGGAGAGAGSAPASKAVNLNPEMAKDEKLEMYCSDPANADADECRVYED